MALKRSDAVDTLHFFPEMRRDAVNEVEMSEPNIESTCMTEITKDGRYVRILFRQEGAQSLDVLVPIFEFPAVAQVMQIQADQIARKQAARSLLGPGQSLSVAGFRLLPAARGDLLLTIFARIQDADGERGTKIPIPLRPQSAETLRQKLHRYLSPEIDS